MKRHLIWDWNGTLLDDTQAALNALNRMLKRRGREAIAMEYYRDNFVFPSRKFYDMIGIDVPDSQWAALAQEYHDAYLAENFSLNEEALPALAKVRELGVEQSIASALRQDLLEAQLRNFAVADYFLLAFGTNNLDGASKLARAQAVVSEVRARSVEPIEFVMIGDAIHDAEVAAAIGAKCVLQSRGTHSAERLRAVAPTASGLLEAVGIAMNI